MNLAHRKAIGYPYNKNDEITSNYFASLNFSGDDIFEQYSAEPQKLKLAIGDGVTTMRAP